MTLRKAALLGLLVGGLSGCAALGGTPSRGDREPTAVAVVVADSETPGALRADRAGARAAIATARRLAPRGRIRLEVVGGPLDARAAVAQAAATADVIVGSGPGVQPALAAAQIDRRDLRVAALP